MEGLGDQRRCRTGEAEGEASAQPWSCVVNSLVSHAERFGLIR